MYLMVGLELENFVDITSDMEFAQMLIKEQSVFCLPASVSLYYTLGNYLSKKDRR
jgi:tyrosine aminotransferase